MMHYDNLCCQVKEQQEQEKMQSLLDGTAEPDAPFSGEQLAVEGAEDLEALARELERDILEDPLSKKQTKDNREASDNGGH